MNNSAIFISYRRVERDGKSVPEVYIQWLRMRLEQEFGDGSVFLDIDSIPPGAKWKRHIAKQLEKSTVTLVVIDKVWTGERDGTRRIDDPNDYLRQEVEVALDSDLQVIPVLVDTKRLPELPPTLQRLQGHQAVFLSTDRWSRELDDFILRLQRIPGLESVRAVQASPPPETGPTITDVFKDTWKRTFGTRPSQPGRTPRKTSAPPRRRMPPELEEPIVLTEVEDSTTDETALVSEPPDLPESPEITDTALDPLPPIPSTMDSAPGALPGTPTEPERKKPSVERAKPDPEGPRQTKSPGGPKQRTHPLLGELMMLFHESAEFHRLREPAVQAHLLRAANSLVALNRRAYWVQERYVVAVAGTSDRGRTCVLRSLIEGAFQSDPVLASSGTTVELRYGTLPRFREIRQPPGTPYSEAFQTNAELLAALARRAAERNGAPPEERCCKLEIQAPLPILSRGLIILLLGAFEDEGTEAVEAKRSDPPLDGVNQTIWCLAADECFVAEQPSPRLKPVADVCDDVVLIGRGLADETLEASCRRAIDGWFTKRAPRFHLAAADTLPDDDRQAVAGEGDVWAARYLVAYLNLLSTLDGRRSDAGKALLTLASDTGEWLRLYRTSSGQGLPAWWPSDSWIRWTGLTVKPRYQKLYAHVSDRLAKK